MEIVVLEFQVPDFQNFQSWVLFAKQIRICFTYCVRRPSKWNVLCAVQRYYNLEMMMSVLYVSPWASNMNSKPHLLNEKASCHPTQRRGGKALNVIAIRKKVALPESYYQLGFGASVLCVIQHKKRMKFFGQLMYKNV